MLINDSKYKLTNRSGHRHNNTGQHYHPSSDGAFRATKHSILSQVQDEFHDMCQLSTDLCRSITFPPCFISDKLQTISRKAPLNNEGLLPT